MHGYCMTTRESDQYFWVQEGAMKTRNKIILDEDLAKVGVALRRSAKRAREEAGRSNTPLIIFENGRVIKKKIVNKK